MTQSLDLVELRAPSAFPDWYRLTFPAYAQRLRALPDSGLLALGAIDAGVPVGMAMAEIDSEQSAATLLSIFVIPSHRGQGLGTRLIELMEDKLRRRGVEDLVASYAAGKATTTALERLFVKRDWISPQRLACIAYSTGDKLAQVPWVQRGQRLRPGWELFAWATLAAEDRADVVRRKVQEDWFPDELGPFFEEESVETQTSFGLRYDGQVVGWIINHRISPTIHRFTRLWVDRELQQTGAGTVLIAAAIEGYVQSRIPRACMCVYVENPGMLRFYQRRLAPWATEQQEIWSVSKALKGQKT